MHFEGLISIQAGEIAELKRLLNYIHPELATLDKQQDVVDEQYSGDLSSYVLQVGEDIEFDVQHT